jgi:hypothetical protein
MVAAGGVDHRIGAPGFGSEKRGIVEPTRHRLRAEGREPAALLGIAYEPAQLVAVVEQVPPI